MRSEDLAYFEEEEFLECLAKYEKAIQDGLQPYMDADELTDIAEYYMIKNREQDANKCILLAKSLHPEAIDPQVFIARQHLFHGNIEEAKRIAKSITEQGDREVVFLWAEIALKEGLWEKGEAILLDELDRMEEEQDFFIYDCAGVFMDYEEWELALKWAQRLQTEYPKFDKTNQMLADIYVSCGKVDDAIPILQGILDKDPFRKEAWELMAEAQSGMERYNEALESIDYLLAIDEKSAQGRVIRANCLFHLNRSEEAHQQYLDYLEDVPFDGGIRFYDAVVLSSLERLEESHKQACMAIEYLDHSTNEYYQSLMLIANILSRQKKSNEAIAYVDRAYSESGREKDAEYHFMLGHIYLENKFYLRANKSFDKSESMAEDALSMRLMRAIELIENEFYMEGASIIEELLKSNMEDKEENCYPYLAYANYFLKNSAFKEDMEKAMKYNPKLTIYLFAPIFPNVHTSQFDQLQ